MLIWSFVFSFLSWENSAYFLKAKLTILITSSIRWKMHHYHITENTLHKNVVLAKNFYSEEKDLH